MDMDIDPSSSICIDRSRSTDMERYMETERGIGRYMKIERDISRYSDISAYISLYLPVTVISLCIPTALGRERYR